MAVRAGFTVEIDGFNDRTVMARVDEDGNVHIAWGGNIVVIPAGEAKDFLLAALGLIGVKAKGGVS